MSYVRSWVADFPDEHDFLLGNFISEDLSGILYGRAPVIFLGANAWAEKRYLSESAFKTAFEKWNRHLMGVISKVDVPVFIVVVPEKDVVVRRISDGATENDICEGAVDGFLSEWRKKGVGAYFIDGLIDSPDRRLNNYWYYDSHLLSRDYLRIFYSIIQGFSLLGGYPVDDIRFERGVLYGDMDIKLNNPSRMEGFLHLNLNNRGVSQIGGAKTFCDPLRATWQSFKCERAPLKGKVVICGDSHSSIYSQRKLTYLLAGSFEYCDFYWDPLCMNWSAGSFSGADYVVLEISERFLFS